MRVHVMPPWIPVPFEPKRKPVKPRKFFHTEDSSEPSAGAEYPAPKTTGTSEEAEEKHTDILA